jgi:tetratricopeptide (TPR) repeat protein
MAEINSDWDLYGRLREHSRFLGRFSPVSNVSGKLRASYMVTAEEIIEHYRTSSDPVLGHFDWQKAAVCLQHALAMDSRDRIAQGRLELCKGYLALTAASPNADAAKQSFDKAAALMPRSPDPHLGLARLFVYVSKNIGRAMAELHEAQRTGQAVSYQPGPREMEQEADGYRFRADQEFDEARKLHGKSRDQQMRYLRLAQHDYERARQLYEPIMGYSNVSVALHNLDDSDRSRQRLDEVLRRPAPPAHRKRLKLASRTNR